MCPVETQKVNCQLCFSSDGVSMLQKINKKSDQGNKKKVKLKSRRGEIEKKKYIEKEDDWACSEKEEEEEEEGVPVQREKVYSQIWKVIMINEKRGWPSFQSLSVTSYK